MAGYVVQNNTVTSSISTSDGTVIDNSIKSIRALEESGSDASAVVSQNLAAPLVAHIKGKFERCKMERQPHEGRWLKQYRNFRGLYGSDIVFRDSEQSRAFVKITKTKVMAAYGQILEILFQGNKFPLSVEPTEKPDGIAEYAHMDPQGSAQGGAPEAPDEESPDEAPNVYGWQGDGREIPPGATYGSLLGGLDDQYKGADLKEGPAPDANQMPQIEPAKIAAQNMEKAILDQITETDGHVWLRKSIFEMCLLGQGVLKGPFTVEKTLHDWEKDEESDKMVYSPRVTKAPAISYVSVWDFYPDPDAKNMKEAEYTIERHKMSRSELRKLGKRPFFITSAINRVLDGTPDYQYEWWETQLSDGGVQTTPERFEVLEYWGLIDRHLLEDTGLDIGFSIEDLDEVQVNTWICNGEVLRCVLNPFTPAMIPYYASPYEEHEYQMWGVGVAENMEDCQDIMNAFCRLAIDNAAIASNLVFDIDETSLVPGQDMKVFPGKTFRRQAGQPGQSIFALKFPNTFTDAMNVFDRFRQLSDEATGLPSYSHGQTGVTSTTRTSSGLSMLMGAAALNIKSVIKNVDDFILQPLGEAFFHWNMQFNEDETIRGDLCIKARGTSGLMAKEIKSQRLLQFLQTTANPMLAPYTKYERIIRDIAETLDLDPDEYTNNPSEAAIYAHIMGMAGGIQGGQSGSPPKMDASGVGGGNIGQGNVPQPGTPGFTGSPQDQTTSANSANAGP